MQSPNTERHTKIPGHPDEVVLLDDMIPESGEPFEHRPLRTEQYRKEASPMDPSTKDNVPLDAMKPRKFAALSTLGQAALDLCLALLPFYFLAFAVYASRHAGESVTADVPAVLLRAALIGPTLFPIIFTAIIGRFITSFAAWRLEHGVRVGLVEYLIGSRTVSGVISTPIRLRFLHYGCPALFILWALSPLDGQASLRVVSLGPFYQDYPLAVPYLNTTRGYIPTGGSTIASHGAAANAAFVGALDSPLSSKQNAQDLYGHAKVPLLEDAILQSVQPDSDGWYSTLNHSPEYSSMIGLPSSGVRAGGKSFFNVESSYLYPNCTLTLQPLWTFVDGEYRVSPFEQEYEEFRNSTLCNNGRHMDMSLQLQERVTNPGSNRSAPGTTQTRTVKFSSKGYSANGTYITMATCNVSTTRVEVRYECDDAICASVAIRESRRSHDFEATTRQLDDMLGQGTQSLEICKQLVNSTREGHASMTSPVEFYIFDPSHPLLVSQDRPILADVGEIVFSQRLAQLINTLWISGIAPNEINGNFTADDRANNATVRFQTENTVLVCNEQWLAVLIISSSAICTAGIATIVLNLVRKGPEVLDNFTTMLRDNPHIQIKTGPSMEDGPDKSRRLRKARVILGDVNPEEDIGHVALATSTAEQRIHRLRANRSYL